MKKQLPRLIKIAALLLVLLISTLLLQEFVLCHADHNRQRVKGFYLEEKDSLDLVLIGASEVYSDFAPGRAYDTSGVTSYLYATQSNSVLNYKAQLKNTLDRQKNALIVIELNGVLYDNDEEITKEANLRNYADNVPLDGVKAEWINENIKSGKAEYVFPIIKYHTVWPDFPSNMLYQKTIVQNRLRGYNLLKGMLNETAVFKSDQRTMNSMLPKMASRKQPVSETAEKALRELLQFCKDEKLDNVVFARFPHLVVKRTYARFELSNYVADIVNEYGFDYLNFERDFNTTGLDETRDFYNLDHLNIYGQQKFTDLLTKTLKEGYGLKPAQRSAAQKEEWDTCADYYKAYYNYSDALIKKGEVKELSEDSGLISELDKL